MERFNSILKPGYPVFAAQARRWLRDAASRGRHFDVAHQVTPVAIRYPSPLAGAGIPYLVGPMGGSLTSPPGFLAEEGTAPWYMKLRSIDDWRLRHDPALRRSLSGAAVVLGIAPYVRELLRDVPLHRFEVMRDTALTELPPRVDRSASTGTTRLLYVGRLVRTKGARDAIRALALAGDLDVHLDVVGSGPDADACQAAAREAGVSARVTFHGRLPRGEIDAIYRDADIFVFPSYREAGGSVQYEAMGWGLPVVVGNRGGTGAAVPPDCGILVNPIDPAQYSRDVAQAVRRLVLDPEARRRMGERAREHVRSDGLWDRKIEHAEALYEEAARDAR